MHDVAAQYALISFVSILEELVTNELPSFSRHLKHLLESTSCPSPAAFPFVARASVAVESDGWAHCRYHEPPKEQHGGYLRGARRRLGRLHVV